MSPKKTQKTPRHFFCKTRSRPAAPQRFPCPSRGTNCPIHLCRWRCQLPGQGQVFNSKCPFSSYKKKNKRKAKKMIIFQTLSNHAFFRGNKIFQLFGGNSRFFSAHLFRDVPKVKVPQNDIHLAFPRGLHFRELGPTVQPGRKRVVRNCDPIWLVAENTCHYEPR